MDIPGYKIVRELGQGGMSRVYLAIQENFEREVALKVMLPELLADATFSERFLREAKIVGQLSHPHIVAVFDVGVHENHHYISMSYHDDGDLKGRVKNGITPQESLFVVQQVAQALDFAHKQGFVHRDIKPENVLFRKDGTVVLSDFGISKAMDSNTNMTSTGTAIGTPRYMSPEQAGGKKVDGRADLYSLGVMLFEMLTGKVPYDAEDSIAIAVMHVTEPVPVLPEHLQLYQPLIDRMMAKQPDERYQTGAEIVIDIHSYLTSQSPSISGPTGTVMVNTAAAITNSQQTVAASISQKTAVLDAGAVQADSGARHIPVQDAGEQAEKKGGKAGLIAGLMVLVLAAAGGFYFYSQSAKPVKNVSQEQATDNNQRGTQDEPATDPVVSSAPSVLIIDSLPEDADIYIDGRYQGITPVKLPDITGEVELKIKKDGYTTWEKKLNLSEGETENVFARLEKTASETGEIPPASIVKKPAAATDPAGKQGGAPANYALFVVLDPSDARVSILNSDKKFFNGINLQKGTYDLGISKNGYKTVKKTISLTRNMQLKVTLEKQKKAPEKLSAGKIISDKLKSGGTSPEMVVLPVSSFKFGSPEFEVGRTSHDVNQTEIKISKQFAIGRYETTFDDFEKYTGNTGARPAKDRKRWGRGRRPVINVSWKDATAYAAWLSDQTGHKYRLPTEQEWEYAARAGSQTAFSTGACISPEQSNFNYSKRHAKCKRGGKEHNKTVVVGTYAANAWGVYDMHGNVWEWTGDCWVDSKGTTKLFDNLMGGAKDGCKRRVVRGGAYNSRPAELRSAHRFKFPTLKSNSATGFRLVRELD